MNKEKREELVLGLLQFDITWENPGKNRSWINKLPGLHDEAFDLLILPEVFTTGFTPNVEKVAEQMDGETIEWMKEQATSLQTALCGSLFIRDAGSIYNRWVWAFPDGTLATYDKRHLFRMEGEGEKLTRGDQRPVIAYKGWKIFPQICYDLRFPVWSRNNLQYDLMINVANWPASRQKVWKTLLKARAIENQCYVVGVNRIGQDELGLDYKGGSRVIGPKGTVVHRSGKKEGISRVTIDLTSLHAFREKFNTLDDADAFLIVY
ncbi:MAG TPA: nitrilase-related carbon-nitrogen hydrolase [Prolixibacteraceae bacterium]|nr:nitrilase-related carbon-nitrogen hydrolase [Prolixibacteraceae bacterium]